MREVIGTFSVADGSFKEQTVFINQETILDDNGTITETRKYLTLNSIDGEEVIRTGDHSLLQLSDGTVLRKTSNVHLGVPDQDEPLKRRRNR